MKTPRLFFTTFMLLIASIAAFAQSGHTRRFNQATFRPLPPLAVSGEEGVSAPDGGAGQSQGVSAPYAGISNGWAVVAGGCNFPGVPAAQGGQKRYYSDIYVLNLAETFADASAGKSATSGKNASAQKDAYTGATPSVPSTKWQRVGSLPTAAAYGVSVSVGDGVVIIGGTDGKQSLRSVRLIKINTDAHNAGKNELMAKKDGRVVSIIDLPSLPIGLDNMAGAYGGGYIYVAGGQSNGHESHKAFRLKYPISTLSHKENQWEPLPDFPGAPRLQPVASVQQGSVGSFFYLLGGYNANGTNNDGLRYDPIHRIWAHTSPIVVSTNSTTNGNNTKSHSVAISGGAAVSSGASFIVCFGGVDKDIFSNALKHPAPDYMLHEPDWYRFRDKMLVYNTITDAWSEMEGSYLLRRAGAALVDYVHDGRHQWILIDGEVKPGVRSADVTDTMVSYTAHFGWLNWMVLIVYLLAMLGMGWYFMHREKSSQDFFTGGGRIPWWAAGISIFATMLSAITYMSIPAKAYATDWTYYPMQICILLISFPVIKYYLPFFRRLNVTTAYEYLERRFSYATRLMASVLFIVFMVARMALVLFLPSLAMEAVTGINIYTCIILMAIITIVYCTMGGMEAVVWGDVVQGIILVGGAILAAVYLIFQTEGGAGGFLHIALDNDKLRLFDWSLDWRSATFWVVILGGLANNLISYSSDQTVIQRYLTTKDERSAARGILTNGLMSVFVTIAFFTIGTGLYTFFKTHPAQMDITMQKTDAVFPFFMMSQLPAGIAGLLIAAVFAATMSTIASNINSISTAFTIDMYKKALPHSSDHRLLLTARVAGIVSGVLGMLIAILMATTDIQSLLDYFNTILGLLSGGIGALFLMGIFFPRIGKGAALVGFLTGTLTVVLMNFFTQVHFLLFGFISIAVSVVVALLLSLIWPQRAEQPGLTWRTLNKG